MYLIFAKKQKITYFDPLGGQGWAKFVHPDGIKFFESHSALFAGLERNRFCPVGLCGFISTVVCILICGQYQQYFPTHTNIFHLS